MQKQEKVNSDDINQVMGDSKPIQLCFDFYQMTPFAPLTLSNLNNVVNINQKAKEKFVAVNNTNNNVTNHIASTNTLDTIIIEEEFLKHSIWTEILETQWKLDKKNIILDKNTNIYQQLNVFIKQNKLRKDSSWYLPIIYAMYEEILKKSFLQPIPTSNIASNINTTNSSATNYNSSLNSLTNEEVDNDNTFFYNVKSYVKRKKLTPMFASWYAKIYEKDFLAFKKIKKFIAPTESLLIHYNKLSMSQTKSKRFHPIEYVIGLNAKKHTEIRRNCFSLNTFIPAGSFYDNKYIHLNTYYFEKEITQGKSYASYNYLRIFLHELGHAIYNDILHDRVHAIKKIYKDSFLKNHAYSLRQSYINYRNYNFNNAHDKSAMAYYVKYKIGKRINTKLKKYQFLFDRGFEESFAESFSILCYIMLCEEYLNIKKTIKVLKPILELLNKAIDWKAFGFNEIAIIRKQKNVSKFFHSLDG